MPRRSWSINELEIAVSNSNCIMEVLKKLGLRTAGGNYTTIKKYIKQYGINTDHFDPHSKSIEALKSSAKSQQIPLNRLLKKNVHYSSSRLKSRLIKAHLLKNECYKCGLKPTWNGKPLNLQLDHVNGVHTDCRLPNLRILCPNCHSQTKNFAGRSVEKKNTTTSRLKKCPECGTTWIYKNSNMCLKCYNISRRKVERPSKEDLRVLLKSNSWVAVGRMFGVSDNAVRKWAKTYNLVGV